MQQEITIDMIETTISILIGTDEWEYHNNIVMNIYYPKGIMYIHSIGDPTDLKLVIPISCNPLWFKDLYSYLMNLIKKNIEIKYQNKDR